MFEKLLNLLKNKDGSKADADKRNDAIVLKIINKDKTIARLSTEDDGKMFTLVYTDDFSGSGVPPFHTEEKKDSDVPPFHTKERNRVEIGKTYRSPILWYAFAARVPNPSRSDFKEALKRANLTGDEPVLELIGKMSRVSISRSWRIEIDQ